MGNGYAIDKRWIVNGKENKTNELSIANQLQVNRQSIATQSYGGFV